MTYAIIALAFVAVVIIALTLYVKISRLVYTVPYKADELHFAVTPDGYKLALYRRKPAKQKYSRPVIFCHGLGAGRYNLDFPGHSLAQFFADAGFDVWVCELRGVGASTTPHFWNCVSPHWTFDDLVEKDVPSIIEKVLEVTKADKAAWVGHSMGGMLMYAYLAKNPQNVAAAFAIASPAQFKGFGWTKATVKLAYAFAWIRTYPQRALAAAFAPLFGRVKNPILVERQANIENLDREFVKPLIVNLASDLSFKLIMHFGNWIQGDKFDSFDGKTDYFDGIKNISVPLGFAAGSADYLAPARSVKAGFDICGSPEKFYREFGKKFGDKADYGHGDIVFGKTAKEEVFPVVLDYIARRAGKIE